MARRNRHRSRDPQLDAATRNFTQAKSAIAMHPMFAPLWLRVWVDRSPDSRCPPDGWAVVTSGGAIHVHPTRKATPEEWMHVLAHCLLHLGLDHFQPQENPRAWNAACDCVVARFLSDLKFGRIPEEMRSSSELPSRDEHELYRLFKEDGIPPRFASLGTAGKAGDMVYERERAAPSWAGGQRSWSDCLKEGIAEAVSRAIEVAAGNVENLSRGASSRSNAQIARRWFISSYPLLGALAETFEIVEDPLICQRLGISVAAVDIEGKEILINPVAALSLEEARFVLAHELLHVGLRLKSFTQSETVSGLK